MIVTDSLTLRVLNKQNRKVTTVKIWLMIDHNNDDDHDDDDNHDNDNDDNDDDDDAEDDDDDVNVDDDPRRIMQWTCCFRAVIQGKTLAWDMLDIWQYTILN